MNNTIPELVSSFIEGDQDAFKALIARFRKRIYALAFQIVGNHLDADEVVQETFIRVYHKRKQLKDVKYFSTFLVRIATNYAIDLLRKRKSHSWISEDTTSLPGDVQLVLSRKVETPGEKYENKRLLEEISRALETLPPKQRLTAILHDVEGYTKEEIAEAFNCPQATVRSNLHIARKKLKKILKQRLGSKEQK
ncbi:MAG: RNA polymerase sigma factor [candidate division Zixibacteria bacterium]|nr:RNA polymerase sigma factor [candidate division Zixibacteria bacterium]